MIRPLQGRRILLGVTGSIAAFKAAALASQLTQQGAQVTTILTAAATRFITPLTFRALTGQAAYTDADLWGEQGHILHVDLARQADALVVVPATADTLARLALGRADSLLGLAALALRPQTPLVLVPAMDAGMWEHPATQAHVQVLRERGAHFIGPVEGRLASGLVARGRMAEAEEVLAQLRRLLALRMGPWRGQRVLVTAGPTWEPLDPVRVLTNRSSGRQGYAIAQAALDAGAEVVLISGPVALPVPYDAHLVQVETAQQMHDAVLAHLKEADFLFKVAAVADYRPAQVASAKIKKNAHDLTLHLTRNPDILLAVHAYRRDHDRPRVVVGFAAESHPDPTRLRAKLTRKGLDLLAVNDITATDAGFRVATNRLRLLYADGREETWPLRSKVEVARHLLARAWHVAQKFALWLRVPIEAWEDAQGQAEFAPPILRRQGRIPLARPDQSLAARFPDLAARRDVVDLLLDGRHLPHPPRWEAWQGDLAPYLEEPIPRAAVREVHSPPPRP